MICYRIEHPRTGLGPYQLKAIGNSLTPEIQKQWLLDCAAMRESHSKDTFHLAPEEDGIGIISGKWQCAFQNLIALEDWFEGWLRTLVYDYGFIVVELHLPDRYVKIGHRQIAYDCTKPTYSRKLKYDFPE